MEQTKAAVLARSQEPPKQSLRDAAPVLECVSGQRLYDRSLLDFRGLTRRLKDDRLQDIGQKEANDSLGPTRPMVALKILKNCVAAFHHKV
jgi:hypothetical protein